MKYTDIRKRIESALGSEDFGEAARLSRLAAELQALDQKRHNLLASVESAGSSIIQETPDVAPGSVYSAQPAPPADRTQYRRGLVIELDTDGGAPVQIAERTSAETMVSLMAHILGRWGLG